MTQARSAGALVCPKCGGAMRSYERNDVTIDQCSECRGIFLDRGELERLIDAEGSYYAGGQPQIDPGDAYSDYRRNHDDDHSDYRRKHGDDHGDSWREGKNKRRRGGFLGDLFD